MSKSESARLPTTGPAQLPHSWDLAYWPDTVWPCSTDRARWLLRAYRNELVEAGAIARTGKTLIVLGRGYQRWLDKRVAHVDGFQSNNPNLHQQSAA